MKSETCLSRENVQQHLKRLVILRDASIQDSSGFCYWLKQCFWFPYGYLPNSLSRNEGRVATYPVSLPTGMGGGCQCPHNGMPRGA